jgi:hypothetical protein
VTEAIVAGERCRTLNPSNARAYRILSTLNFFIAEPRRMHELLDRGLRLSPRDRRLRSSFSSRGMVT